MTTLEKFQELANIKFVESRGDFEIGTIQTADGYEIHYMTADILNLNFENEVYYYQPDFDTIMSYIEEHRVGDELLEIEIWDVDEYFDEYYMLDFISDNMDEDEFEKFTNEND